MKFRLALVTGATSGIGESLSRLLAKEGIPLVLSGTRIDRLKELQNELGSLVSTQIVVADLQTREGRQGLVKIIREHSPDLVINNAGFGLYGPVISHSTQEQLDILEVNGNAVLELTTEAVRALRDNKFPGVILNTASAAAFQIIPSLTVYSATKAFVVHFSQSFDIEVQPYGIRVLAACPGKVKTSFINRAGGSSESAGWGVMSPDDVALAMWKQIQIQKPVMIIDWRYRVLTFLSKLLPSRWLAKQLQRDIEKRLQ